MYIYEPCPNVNKLYTGIKPIELGDGSAELRKQHKLHSVFLHSRIVPLLFALRFKPAADMLKSSFFTAVS